MEVQVTPAIVAKIEPTDAELATPGIQEVQDKEARKWVNLNAQAEEEARASAMGREAQVERESLSTSGMK